MEKFGKILSIILLVLTLIFGQLFAFTVTAAELPGTPETPTITEESSVAEIPENTETPATTETVSEAEEPQDPLQATLPNTSDTSEDSSSQNQETTDAAPPTGSTSDNQTGDTELVTGDVSSSGIILNDINSNISGTQGSTGTAAVENTGNGSGSTNSGSIILDETGEANQDNNASLNNGLSVDANTGENSASSNVGNSSIETGDANVSGTIINTVNTNLAGVTVSEFNIEDDYTGDLTLDFAAYCITGCGGDEITVSNTGNGTDSTNSGEVEVSDDNTSFQNNTADVENELILTANSGENTANNNTGGDNNITTGDANVSGSIVNFINNNLLGNVVYGIVNIFGDLKGDIILTEEQLQQIAGSSESSILNTGNGSGSTNSGSIDSENINNTAQFNNADIQNNLTLEAATGDNVTSDNTGGDNEIATGDVLIDAQVTNIANTNTIGGNWWIVLVNEAGNWVGKILGSDGSNIAVSQGSSLTTDPNGTVNITNENNGSDSTNTAQVDTTAENSVTQTNDLALTNNVALTANTGGNSASRNTGGNNQISTGDAIVMLNIVNFVNNNYTGNIFFTVVNVFGSWVGDFVTPGNEKEDVAENTETPTPNQGGQQNSANQDNNSSGNSQGGGENQSPANTEAIAASEPETTPVAAINNQGNQLLVAGVKIVEESQIELPLGQFANDKQQTKEKMRVNLAWLLLILPVLVLLALTGRRLLKRQRLDF